MRLWICLSLLLVHWHAAMGLAISVGTEGSAAPFELAYDPNVQSSLEIVLQVVNESDDPATLLGWELVLHLLPLEGTQGSLLFNSVTEPPDSLFGQEPANDLTEPSDTVFIMDADMDFMGQAVAGHSARNIVQLALVASPTANGTFQLLMREFIPEPPPQGSSWFDADTFEPTAFENATGSALPGFFLLGTIHVSQASQSPDFNGDGVVDAADYVLWRKTDGSPEGYDTWRSSFGAVVGEGASALSTSDGPPGATVAVPEPGTGALASLGLLAGIPRVLRSRVRETFINVFR